MTTEAQSRSPNATTTRIQMANEPTGYKATVKEPDYTAYNVQPSQTRPGVNTPVNSADSYSGWIRTEDHDPNAWKHMIAVRKADSTKTDLYTASKPNKPESSPLPQASPPRLALMSSTMTQTLPTQDIPGDNQTTQQEHSPLNQSLPAYPPTPSRPPPPLKPKNRKVTNLL